LFFFFLIPTEILSNFPPTFPGDTRTLPRKTQPTPKFLFTQHSTFINWHV